MENTISLLIFNLQFDVPSNDFPANWTVFNGITRHLQAVVTEADVITRFYHDMWLFCETNNALLDFTVCSLLSSSKHVFKLIYLLILWVQVCLHDHFPEFGFLEVSQAIFRCFKALLIEYLDEDPHIIDSIDNLFGNTECLFIINFLADFCPFLRFLDWYDI